jgi:hypothetical protein
VSTAAVDTWHYIKKIKKLKKKFKKKKKKRGVALGWPNDQKKNDRF